MIELEIKIKATPESLVALLSGISAKPVMPGAAPAAPQSLEDLQPKTPGGFGAMFGALAGDEYADIEKMVTCPFDGLPFDDEDADSHGEDLPRDAEPVTPCPLSLPENQPPAIDVPVTLKELPESEQKAETATEPQATAESQPEPATAPESASALNYDPDWQNPDGSLRELAKGQVMKLTKEQRVLRERQYNREWARRQVKRSGEGSGGGWTEERRARQSETMKARRASGEIVSPREAAKAAATNTEPKQRPVAAVQAQSAKNNEVDEKTRTALLAILEIQRLPVDDRTTAQGEMLLRAVRNGIIPDCGHSLTPRLTLASQKDFRRVFGRPVSELDSIVAQRLQGIRDMGVKLRPEQEARLQEVLEEQHRNGEPVADSEAYDEDVF